VLVCIRDFWVVLVLLGTLTGCLSSASSSASAAAREADERVLLDKLQERAKLQNDRIAELEVRVSLLEAEAKQMRVDTSPTREVARETVRIGSGSGTPWPSESGDEPRTSGRAPRPVLRIYSRKPSEENLPPIALPTPPPGISNQLPVAPLPETDAERVSPPSGGQHVEPADQASLAGYREALALVRSRQFPEAQQALTAFLVRFPSHPYSDKALYWLGEVFYAKQEYQRALEQFEALTGRFVSSDKMPDALLKIGMCYRHLGDNDKARDFFRRVYSQYPKSDAARVALREGAS
jgi:tol-pal system protein YbgF